MEVRFHRRVQRDLDGILASYNEVSPELGDDFFAEFQVGLRRARENPTFYHFDSSGLRRYNLERFPYHFLYDIRGNFMRVWVLRHDRRNPSLVRRRFV